MNDMAMPTLNDAARELIGAGALGHLVTLNDDGSPHVAIVWVGLDGEGLRTAHLDGRQRKLRNMRRDPRVAISFEASTANQVGMRHYLVVHGRANITEGGAPEALHDLAQVYVGPGATFPPMPDPPPGFIAHISVERISGIGPWCE